MKSKYKLIILILFIYLFFFNINNVLANEGIIIPEIPENKPYIITYDNTSGSVVEIAYPYKTGTDYKFYLTEVSGYKEITYSCDDENGKWMYASFDSSANTFGSFKQSLYDTLLFEKGNRSIYNSSINVYIDDTFSTVFFQASGIDNDYNYDDYVLPELPKDLYKYNYIIKATVSSSEGTGTIYMLHSHSSPLEFYNGGCSSCQEDCSSDCPDTPISYCDHILSSGNAKVYTYIPSDYPSNDVYGGNSLWTLFSEEYYFSSSWEHHFHWGTSLKDVLVYSDFTISPKDSSGNVVEVLDPNNYEDFKDDVIDTSSDYVINENYYNNVVDKSFLDNLLDFIKNFFKNLSNTFKILFQSIFVPEERIF